MGAATADSNVMGYVFNVSRTPQAPVERNIIFCAVLISPEKVTLVAPALIVISPAPFKVTAAGGNTVAVIPLKPVILIVSIAPDQLKVTGVIVRGAVLQILSLS